MEICKWGLSVVWRYWKGDLVLAGAKSLPSTEDPAVAECLALIWAMELICESEHKSVVLETDCLKAFNEFTTPNHRSQIHDLLEDIRELAEGLESFSFSFAPRTYNRVAHSLAKCFSKAELVHWMKEYLYNILSLAVNDVNHPKPSR